MRKEKRIPQIYIITNNINDKIYIGKTDRLMVRWGAHKSGCKNPKLGSYNMIISKAFRKYGIKNFSISPIAYFNTMLEAKEAEIFWIAETRKFLGRKNVYNATDGGEGLSGWKQSSAAKEKCRVASSGSNNPRFGKKDSEETLKRKSEAQSGEKHHNFGVSMPQKTRCAISKANKGKLPAATILKPEQVIEIRFLSNTTNISRKELSKMFNVSVHTIAAIRSGRSWSHLISNGEENKTKYHRKIYKKQSFNPEEIIEIRQSKLGRKFLAKKFEVSEYLIWEIRSNKKYTNIK